MPNIKSLQMWKDICADARISVSKTLLGLRTTATYTITDSSLCANIIEYSPVDGEKLKNILESARSQVAEVIGDFRPKAVANGNYMAEVCYSQDGKFLAVQLYQFARMSYEPVTETKIYEGDTAQTMVKMFQ